MWEIREEQPSDRAAIDALVARSFGPGRFAKSAYRLREGVDPEAGLSYVAIEDGALRGSNRFWPVIVGETPALLLGPLAVESERRGRGMGIQLMQKGIDEARAKGHRVMILVGDLPYYQRVGFVPIERGRVQDARSRRSVTRVGIGAGRRRARHTRRHGQTRADRSSGVRGWRGVRKR